MTQASCVMMTSGVSKGVDREEFVVRFVVALSGIVLVLAVAVYFMWWG